MSPLAPRGAELPASRAQQVQALGLLAGGVLHDFNNLLTVVGGFARMMLTDHPPRRFREPLAEIEHAATLAGNLSRRVLEFGSNGAVTRMAVSLNEVVRRNERIFRWLLTNEIELVLHLNAATGMLQAPEGQLEQVLLNLVVNARHAMTRGGQLRIETADFFVDELFAAAHPRLAPGPHLLLMVSDSGRGMPEEVRTRLCEPFFTTRPEAGFGLGMATVRSAVHDQHGELFIDTESGFGTTFQILFPAAV